MDRSEALEQKQEHDQANNDAFVRKFSRCAYFVGNDNKLKKLYDKIECCNKENCEDSDCLWRGNLRDNLHDENLWNEVDEIRDRIRLTLKNYLELNNVSFLFGTGSSIKLGAESIRDIPGQIEEKIKNNNEELYNIFKFLVRKYQAGYDNNGTKYSKKENVEKDEEGIYRRKNKELNDTEKHPGNIDVPLEEFMNYLLGLKYVSEISNNINILNFSHDSSQKSDITLDYKIIDKLINLIKLELFKLCDLKYESKDLVYHKKLIKSLLSRPLILKRANIFTTNYDLAFEDAFEELGVHYINGFAGFNKRYFRPEVFDYDMYYPSYLTEGKVNRVEKVIKYFKLHGSLTWVREDNISAENIYGLREFPIEYIREKYKKFLEEENNEEVYYSNSDRDNNW